MHRNDKRGHTDTDIRKGVKVKDKQRSHSRYVKENANQEEAGWFWACRRHNRESIDPGITEQSIEQETVQKIQRCVFFIGGIKEASQRQSRSEDRINDPKKNLLREQKKARKERNLKDQRYSGVYGRYSDTNTQRKLPYEVTFTASPEPPQPRGLQRASHAGRAHPEQGHHPCWWSWCPG